MARDQAATPKAPGQRRGSNAVVASTLIGSHSIQHMYQRGFLVIIPQIYAALNLAPLQVGLLDAVRQGSGGVFSMGGGMMVDRLQHLRGLFLGASLALMALGYLVVGLAPSYLLILVALSFAASAGSLWHPPALGILSQRYPQRRGLMLSLHRSTGNLGETVAPILVGALLAVIAWQTVLLWAAVPTVIVALAIMLLLWNVGGARVSTQQGGRALGQQFRDLGSLLRNRGLLSLIVVSGVRGMGDRGLLLFLPLYLSEELGMGSFMQGVHLSLLTAAAIVCGPLIGVLSDRIGRKPVMVGVMAVSAVLASLMIVGNSGVSLMLLIALLGTVMFSINSLVQAAAMDLGEGKRLEGSLIGLLWGSNAAFGFFPPLILGVLVGAFGFEVIFPYSAVLYLVGALAAISLPRTATPVPAAS